MEKRKIKIFLLFFVLMFMLSACGSIGDGTENTEQTSSEDLTSVAEVETTSEAETDGGKLEEGRYSCSYTDHCVYTYATGYDEDDRGSGARIIRSKEELTAYCEANKKIFDFDYKGKKDDSFNSVTSNYDENWFAANQLLLIPHGGTLGFNYEAIACDLIVGENCSVTLAVTIEEQVPELYSDAYERYFMIVELHNTNIPDQAEIVCTWETVHKTKEYVKVDTVLENGGLPEGDYACPYTSKIIYTYSELMYGQGDQWPENRVITSKAELAAFCDDYKTTFDFDYRQKLGETECISFNEATAAYDEKLFEERQLILIPSTGTVGVDYSVTDCRLIIGADDSALLEAELETRSGKLTTFDSCDFFVIIEIPAEFMTE